MFDSQETLNSRQLLGPPFVRCFFSSSESRQLEQLQRGQEIVVQGTLANPVLNGSVLATDLNQCRLLAVEDSQHRLVLLDRGLRLQ